MTATTLVKEHALLDEAAKLNATLEQSYLALSVVLVQIHDTEAYKETGHEEWAEYYKNELGREKSTISRLLEVGRWLIEKNNGLLPSNLGYQRLLKAIKQNPDEEPAKVLAIAATWHEDDYKAEAKEICAHPKLPIPCCPDCFKLMGEYVVHLREKKP